MRMSEDRLKIRVWDKRKNNYIENFVFNFINKSPYITVEYFDNEYAYTHTFEEEEIIIEQCTGLKDKNSRLIYEGDILQDCEQKINVVFDEENHCFMFKYQKTHAYKPIGCLDVLDGDFEVIGNIHENPELMEE